MILIDKRYTVKFGHAGISQYAEFHEVKGKLIRPRLSISYMKVDEQPSLEGLETIEEVLKAMNKLEHNVNAKIHLINSQPVNVYNNKGAKGFINDFTDKFDKFIEAEAISYWENHLLPIMKKNKWFIGTSGMGASVLIYKNEYNEWDNIKRGSDELEFEYLCSMFARTFKKVEIELKNESGNWVKGFQPFIYLIPQDYLIESGIFIDLD